MALQQLHRTTLRMGIRLIIALALYSRIDVSLEAADNPRGEVSKEWPMVGGDWNNTRYSQLDQINRHNVAGLKAAWISDKFDEEGMSRVTPVVSGGAMFVTAGRQVYALNAKTGARLWSYKTVADRQGWKFNPHIDDPTQSLDSALGAPNTKGVSVASGLVFVGLSDGRVIALNSKTGQLVWSRQTGVNQIREGQWAATAPTYANGIVFSGLSDGDHALRGRLTALDAATGNLIWQIFSIPGPGEPGHDTWPSFNSAWRTGGGGVWTNPPVDPTLSLVYFTTGNAVPAYAGDWRPGNNLYTCSVLAVDIRTGKLKWYYQLIHHDLFEADVGTPIILYDAQRSGRRRKALAVLRADGYLFELDRETGEPILPIEERPVPQLDSQKTAPTQPFPVGGESILMSCDDWKKERLPAGFVLGCMFTAPSSPPPSQDPQNVLAPFPGAKGPLMAYSPQTGFFYAQAHSSLSWPRRSQDPYFLNWSDSVPGLRDYGDVVAIDSRTGKIAWRKRIPPASLAGGPIVTKAGLMFRASGDGNAEAYDAMTGDALWHFQTGMKGAGGTPATYEIDGEQYVAVSMGPAVWAFKLRGKIPAPTTPTGMPVAAPEAFISGPIVDTAEIETTSLEHTLIEPGMRYFVDEYAFNPYRARIKLGSPVLFVNNGTMRHEIVALDGSWSTGPLDPNEQTWIAFSKPGEYTYICKDHPWTYGQIIVSPEDTSNVSKKAAAQVTEGQERYRRSCSTCHGKNLGGSGTAPALTGNTFMQHWESATVADLFDRIRSSMPPGEPASLDRDSYLSIVAYLLHANNVDTGMREISDDPNALRLMKLDLLPDRK